MKPLTWVPVTDTLHVLVRGWLNANQTVGWQPGVARSGTIVDTGYHTHAAATIAALRRHPASAVGYGRIINTHCHSDHMGGNAALQQAFGATIAIPRGEAQHVVPWDPQNLWLAETGQSADVFLPDSTLAAGDEVELGGHTWRAFAAPGHAMEALIFWCATERIAITGDALWQSGTGFVWPQQGSNPSVDAALAALDTIALLGARTIIPGHGAPFTEVEPAITNARSKLRAFADDPRRAARYAAKAFFVFNLLAAGSLTVSEAHRQFLTYPVYARLAREFLATTADSLFDEMLQALVASGAVGLQDGVLTPTMAA